MLEIRNLSVHYGGAAPRAVEAFDLSLGDNEIVTLVGPTGCGKTSVLRSVAGLVPPAAGSVRTRHWCVDATHEVPPEKRNVGLVFQDFALFPHYNVEANITFRCRDRALAERWIMHLGLDSFRRAMPGTLSGGQKQRVALARALAHEPSLLLLDEPLASLDAALKNELRWQIRDALKTAGVPALWVTHDQTEALSVGDRVGIMHQGRLQQIDVPDSCFAHPANRFVAGFLGHVAFLPGQVRGDSVETVIGCIPRATDGALPDGQAVEVMVRPDDLQLDAGQPGNSRVEHHHYEGGTRLYKVQLYGLGVHLKVRTNHAQRHEDGATVCTRLCVDHPLALFAPGQDEAIWPPRR